MDEEKALQQIDAYLHGRISAKEQAKFEQELQSNPELKALLKFHLQAVMTSREAAEEKLRADFDKWYQEEQHQQRSSRILRNRWMIALAAAIAIILVTWIGKNLWDGQTYSDNLQDLYAENIDFPPPPSVRDSKETKHTSHTIQLWKEGLLAYSKAEYSLALARFDTVIADSSFAFLSKAWLYKGLSELGLKKGQEAQASFSHIPKESNSYPESQWYLALAYLLSNDLKGSIQSFESLAKDSTNYKSTQAEAILRALERL